MKSVYTNRLQSQHKSKRRRFAFECRYVRVCLYKEAAVVVAVAASPMVHKMLLVSRKWCITHNVSFRFRNDAIASILALLPAAAAAASTQYKYRDKKQQQHVSPIANAIRIKSIYRSTFPLDYFHKMVWTKQRRRQMKLKIPNARFRSVPRDSRYILNRGECLWRKPAKNPRSFQ